MDLSTIILFLASIILLIAIKKFIDVFKSKSFKLIDPKSIIEIIAKDPDFPKSLYTFIGITFFTILILLLFGIGIIEISIAFLIFFLILGFTYPFPRYGGNSIEFEMAQADDFQRITKMISFYILIICVTLSIILAIILHMFNVDSIFVLIPFGFLLIYFLLIGVFLWISTIYMGRKELSRGVLILRIFGIELGAVGFIASFPAKQSLTILGIGIALALISLLLEKVQTFREMAKEYS